jgi:hypothetical protein
MEKKAKNGKSGYVGKVPGSRKSNSIAENLLDRQKSVKRKLEKVKVKRSMKA